MDNPELVISTILERMQRQLAGLLPREGVEAVTAQVGRILRQGLAELELVPRRELEAHLVELERLTRTVEALEQRIRVLESR